MLVGIMSDSHGRHLMARRAVELFSRLDVEHVIHCGDVGDADVFDELLGLPLTFVWGNTDEPHAALLAHLKATGIQPPDGVPRRVTLGGKRFAVYHGHERGFGRAVEAPDVDYILHGHTHCRCDDRRGAARIINPGALHRAATLTVATLDTAGDELTFHKVLSDVRA